MTGNALVGTPWGEKRCTATQKHLTMISPPSIEGTIETREDYLQCELNADHLDHHMLTDPRSGKPYAFQRQA